MGYYSTRPTYFRIYNYNININNYERFSRWHRNSYPIRHLKLVKYILDEYDNWQLDEQSHYFDMDFEYQIDTIRGFRTRCPPLRQILCSIFQIPYNVTDRDIKKIIIKKNASFGFSILVEENPDLQNIYLSSIFNQLPLLLDDPDLWSKVGIDNISQLNIRPSKEDRKPFLQKVQSYCYYDSGMMSQITHAFQDDGKCISSLYINEDGNLRLNTSRIH